MKITVDILDADGEGVTRLTLTPDAAWQLIRDLFNALVRDV